MQIPKEILKDFLRIYRPGGRYLKSVQDLGPRTAGGRFSIKHSVYLKKSVSTGHLNLTDFSLCCDQLVYVATAYKIMNNELTELKERKGVTYDYFKENKLKGLVARVNRINFLRKVDPLDFNIHLEITKIKKRHNIYYMFTKFNVNKGEFYADLPFVLEIKKSNSSSQ